MTKVRFYINNIEVDADEFYQHNFTEVDIELLFEGALVRKDNNEYRIFMEEEKMKYNNNFYRQFNGRKNKNTSNCFWRRNGSKKDKQKSKATGKVGRPYQTDGWYYDDEAEDYFYKAPSFDPNIKKLYIAYGSNLNKAQMKTRCPHARPVYTGLLSNWELFYAGSKTGNYATIRKCEGKAVPVAVWEIDGLDEYYLDIYEGYPDFYFKDTIRFMTNDGEKEAMVYIMRLDAKEGIPTIHYEKTVRQGYKDFGFDEKYLDESIMAVIQKTLAS